MVSIRDRSPLKETLAQESSNHRGDLRQTRSRLLVMHRGSLRQDGFGCVPLSEHYENASAQDRAAPRLQGLGMPWFLGPQRPEVKEPFPAFRAAKRGNSQEPPREVSPGGRNFPPRNPIQLRGVAARTGCPPGPPRPSAPPAMKAVIAFVAAIRRLTHEHQEVVAQSPAAGAIDAFLAAFGTDLPMLRSPVRLCRFFHRRDL